MSLTSLLWLFDCIMNEECLDYKEYTYSGSDSNFILSDENLYVFLLNEDITKMNLFS